MTNGERWSMTKYGQKFHILKNAGDPSNEGIAVCNPYLKLYGTTGTSSEDMPVGMMCEKCLKLSGYHDHE